MTSPLARNSMALPAGYAVEDPDGGKDGVVVGVGDVDVEADAPEDGVAPGAVDEDEDGVGVRDGFADGDGLGTIVDLGNTTCNIGNASAGRNRPLLSTKV